jgi:hypothetical protein
MIIQSKYWKVPAEEDQDQDLYSCLSMAMSFSVECIKGHFIDVLKCTEQDLTNGISRGQLQYALAKRFEVMSQEVKCESFSHLPKSTFLYFEDTPKGLHSWRIKCILIDTDRGVLYNPLKLKIDSPNMAHKIRGLVLEVVPFNP